MDWKDAGKHPSIKGAKKWQRRRPAETGRAKWLAVGLLFGTQTLIPLMRARRGAAPQA